MQEISYYSFICAMFFITSVLFSYLINSLFLKYSRNLGSRDMGDDTIIRWGARSKPTLGGISFYIAFLNTVIFYNIFIDSKSLLFDKQTMGLIAAVTLGFLMGLADDAYNTKPLLKLLTQIACGAVLILAGIQINLFTSDIFNKGLTIFWVVGMMNSINMLDNMDGITAGTAAFIIIGAMLISLIGGDANSFHFVLMLGLLAALAGFLFFNWHPSKMYMGDTGSQFLGVYLATIGIIYFWNGNPYAHLEKSVLKQVLITGLTFILPIVDTTAVFVNRIRQGKSPFVGGKDHTTHALAFRGLSDRQVAFVFYGIAALSMLLGVLLTQVSTLSLPIIVIFSFFILAVFSTLLFFTMTKKTEKS